VSASAPSPSERLRRVLHDHGAALSRLAAAWTRTTAEREDLLQDISLALLVALPRFRGECPERAFIWRVAHNRCLVAARSRRRHVDDERLLEQASTDPSPLTRMEQHQRARALQSAVARLSEDQRAVIVLSFEGMSHQEIGEVVGASANAIGVRLHRARAALAEALQPRAAAVTATTTATTNATVAAIRTTRTA
jgi:RNA polymerase sigma factor (sigma-70 family)